MTATHGGFARCGHDSGLFGGETVSRAVLVNAATGGGAKIWQLKMCPSGLTMYPQTSSFSSTTGMASTQWLAEPAGLANGVVQTTPGTDGSAGYNYIAKDDDVWLYTGVTSATGDRSIALASCW